VRSLDDVRKMAEKSIDLAVMNSVAQYMTPMNWMRRSRSSSGC